MYTLVQMEPLELAAAAAAAGAAAAVSNEQESNAIACLTAAQMMLGDD